MSRLQGRAYTFAVVMATGGVVLGSLWVVATAAVLVSRAVGAAKREETAQTIVVETVVTAKDIAGFRRALNRAAERGGR